MKRKSKYQRKHQKSRDCTKCKNFGGFKSKNYFVCIGEMFEDQKEPHCHDIYDRDVLKKGTCTLFVPKEIDQNDMVYDNAPVERTEQEDDEDISGWL